MKEDSENQKNKKTNQEAVNQVSADVNWDVTKNNNLKVKGIREIAIGSNTLHKPYEPKSECNPDNGAFFEERSNPLSSKGN